MFSTCSLGIKDHCHLSQQFSRIKRLQEVLRYTNPFNTSHREPHGPFAIRSRMDRDPERCSERVPSKHEGNISRSSTCLSTCLRVFAIGKTMISQWFSRNNGFRNGFALVCYVVQMIFKCYLWVTLSTARSKLPVQHVAQHVVLPLRQFPHQKASGWIKRMSHPGNNITLNHTTTTTPQWSCQKLHNCQEQEHLRCCSAWILQGLPFHSLHLITRRLCCVTLISPLQCR